MNQKKFGVWMDSHHATVVGTEEGGNTFSVVGHVKGEGMQGNSNENAANNHSRTLQSSFFKDIMALTLNATSIHITGTGQVQEQFMHYLAESPQFKNCKTQHSTSNRMSDEKLIEYISEKM